MTDYKSYKKFYTNGDLFTLTGADFYGLVEVENNVAVESSTKKALTSKNTFDTDLAFSRDFKDLYIFFFFVVNLRSVYLYMVVNIARVDRKLAGSIHGNLKEFFDY